jgi:hypothetical protein
MAGSQEVRLRHLIAGAQLEATIDKELQQWTDARDRLHDVGAALIAVSTPVSENLGQETVASALAAFKAVGEKVNERADDIQEIHQALRHAVLVTRQAQAAVAEMDGDQRDKPEFGNGEPSTDEADEMHDLKVYVGQMKLYNSWADARETKSQEHADKVETAWQDAIAVMEKIPDDQTSSGGAGGGGGGGGGTGPIMPTAPTVPTTTPTNPTIPDITWVDEWPDPTPNDPTPTIPTPIPTPTPTPVPPGPHLPTTEPVPPGGGYHPTPFHPGTPGPGPGFDPYPGSTPGIPGTPSTGDVAPTPAVGPGSLSSYAIGGAAGFGALGGLGAGIRAAGMGAAPSGLRSGGTLGASARTAGSAKGSLGARTGGTAAGGAASGRATGRGGSRGAAGGRGTGGVGAGGGRGKDKDKKKRKPATVELFDEDKDWIDDEGASTGVID